MKEEFLHFIWKHQLFSHKELTTTAGNELAIHKAGIHNEQDGGPDFLQGRIKIDNTIWAGNIEIHINASDWFAHNHHKDQSFDNVILHVVYNDDKEVHRANGESIPTLSLADKIDSRVYNQYEGLRQSLQWIPCAKQVPNVDSFIKTQCLERVLIERLATKSNFVLEHLSSTGNDWEAAFFRILARTIGQKVNAEPFLQLAKSISWKILKKHRHDPFQLEALLFGQAGMLAKSFEEEYPQSLKREYEFLSNKYSLQPMAPHLWQFLRLRPQGFPTIRMAQLAKLILNSHNLFTCLRDGGDMRQFDELLNVTASSYWDTHYNFDQPTKTKKKRLGKNMRQLILINAIVPTIFAYGRHLDNQNYKDQALELLEQIPPEQNAIIKKWKELGMKPASAFDTQALLELKEHYCDKRKCLNCSIGNRILQEPLMTYNGKLQF